MLAGLATVGVSAAVAGGVVAATQPSDEAALAPNRGAPSRDVEKRVDRLLRKMTLDEKLNQIQLLSDGQINEDPSQAKKPVGGVFSLVDPVKINEYQKIAVEESRLGIPILFAYDTIHGYRTIFPIPLGASSSFDPSVASDDHRIGARESATVGLKQIYSPMVDVSHEPRWGRIAEAGGEDPYLNSVFSAARVKAAQGRNYAAPDKVVTSVKHYAAYGQPEGGRDYGTTDMSVQRLHNLYLPPFKAAIDAGSDTAMCSFNAINGVPGCANKELETGLLKGKWGFDGFIESDYTAVAELRTCPPKNPDDKPECGHGIAEDGPGAAAAALNAGTDSEMVSTLIRDHGKMLLEQGRISERRIDDAVRRILRVKFRAGLFENPYVDQAKAVDPAQLPHRRRPRRRAPRGGPLDGAAQERGRQRRHAAAEQGQEDRGDRPAGQERPRDARPMVGPGAGRGRRHRVRRHPGPELAADDLRRGLLAQHQRAAEQPARRRLRLRGRLRRGGRGRQRGRPGRARARRAARDERRGRLALGDRPARPAGGADPAHQGDRQAVRRRAVQRPPADARRRRRRRAGDPRGVVPRRRGGQRRRRRRVRQGQPRRQAAGDVPAPGRPGADLLQPRAHGPAVQRGSRSTTRATATSRAASRSTRSASASATASSRPRTCG